MGVESGMDRPMQQILRLGGMIAGVFLWLVAQAGAAQAAEPAPWRLLWQTPASPVAERIASLHMMVLVIITVITVFVAALLAIVVVRFNRRANPVASQTSHHTLLEVAWTVIPVLILVVMAIPSFRLVFFEDRTKDPDMTVKVTGHQWYWEYTYPGQGGIDFLSNMIPQDQLQPGQKRLLDVDNPLVIPVGQNVQLLTTSGDVIHSFFIPSLGVQRYAIPGRTIETWVRVDKPGMYYGECNQICGTNHSYMPIAVKAVSEADFNAWVETAKKQFGADASQPGGAAVKAADAAAPTTLALARH